MKFNGLASILFGTALLFGTNYALAEGSFENNSDAISNLEQFAKDYQPRTVFIQVYADDVARRAGTPEATGSGVLLENGYVLSALHVLGDQSKTETEAQFRDELRDKVAVGMIGVNDGVAPYKLAYIKQDSDYDLVLYQFDPQNVKNLPYACPATEPVEIGQSLASLAFPLAFNLHLNHGVITGKTSNRIDTDAGETYGDSGAAAYDHTGRIIGIVEGTIKANNDLTGISYLVPIQRAAELLAQVEHLPNHPCDAAQPPPKMATSLVEDMDRIAFSGGSSEPNPGCQNHDTDSCISPKFGGTFIPGSAQFVVRSMSDSSGVRSNVKLTVDTPNRICFRLHAQTGACETRFEMVGHASGLEQYAP